MNFKHTDVKALGNLDSGNLRSADPAPGEGRHTSRTGPARPVETARPFHNSRWRSAHRCVGPVNCVAGLAPANRETVSRGLGSLLLPRGARLQRLHPLQHGFAPCCWA